MTRSARPMLAAPAGRSARSVGAGRRLDLDGLRGVAIAVVVLQHLFGWPSGGFIGVDVFFVLSGFLITGLMVDEVERTGTLDVGAFYARRARRILPAAFLVLAVTTAATAAVFTTPRVIGTAYDALASATMVQNWHLIRTGTSYFADDGSTPALQHFWSLAVEEQFYLLWPAAVVIVLWLSRRRGMLVGPSPLGRLGGLIPLVTVATTMSFGIACWESIAKSGWSYFSLESRAWELGVGALIAVAGRSLPPVSRRIGSLLVVGGIATILAGALTLSGAMPFPGPWAVVPVIGAGAVIVGGSNAHVGSRVLLVNAPLLRLGRISYSLYLWHLPVSVFAVALMPASAVVPWVAAAVSVLLAWYSERFVERPFRTLGPRPGRVRAGQLGRRRVRRRRLAPILAACIVVSLAALQLRGPLWIATAEAADDAHGMPSTAAGAPALSGTPAVAAAVQRALAAREWPSAAMAELESIGPSDAAAAAYQGRGCLIDPVGVTAASLGADVARCSFGPTRPKRTMVVVGDSIAVSWLPALTPLASAGWRVVGIGLESCPAGGMPTRDRLARPAFTRACAVAMQRAFTVIAALHPDRVLMSSALGAYQRQVASGDREAAWRFAVQAAIRRLDVGADRVVLVGSPPESTPVTACATRVRGPASCERRPGADWFAKRNAERSAAAAAGAGFVDVMPWFCGAAGDCPAFVDGTIVKADTGHITTAYAQRLTRVLIAALLAPVSRGMTPDGAGAESQDETTFPRPSNAAPPSAGPPLAR